MPWKVACFDGDGQPDIIVLSICTGAGALWLMNGDTVIYGAYSTISPGTYQILGPR